MSKVARFQFALLVALIASSDAVGGESTVPLAPVGKKKLLYVRQKGRQSVRLGSFAGRSAAKLTWHSGSKPLLEASFPPRPTLSAFHAGVKLSIPVNTDGFPGLSSSGVRVIDANGEIYQFGRLKLPKGKGWQTWHVDLRPQKATDHWGGHPTGKNHIDAPVRLLSLVFNAPKNQITKDRYLLVGDIRRNPFDSKDISPVVRLRPVQIALVTDVQPNVVKVGEEAKAHFLLTNPKDHEPIVFDLSIRLESLGKDRLTIKKNGVSLKPGESTKVKFGGHLKRTGWYRAIPVLRVPGSTAVATKPSVDFVYLSPAGTRKLPPSDGFRFGIDARVRNAAEQKWVAQACALIGADYIRSGRVWTAIQPKSAEQYDWQDHVAILEMLQKQGLRVQYGLCFTPSWAARESYRQRAWKTWKPLLDEARRKRRKGRIGAIYNKVSAELSRTPPRLEVWQKFVRSVAEKNKSRGVFAYEIWNEPDLRGFYRGTTDEYIQLQKTSFNEIRAVDPKALVLTGGFATLLGHHGHQLNPNLIKRAILETQDHYDAICLHQHGRFRTFQQAIDGPLAQLRGKLKNNKPLFFSESGVPVDGDFSRMDQAAAVVKRIVFARARGAIAYSWFVLHAKNQHMDNYSMLDANRNNQPRPAFATYNELVRMLRGKRFEMQADAGTGNWLFLFAAKDCSTLVGWNEDAPSAGQRILVKIPEAATAEEVDMMGNASPVDTSKGVIAWALTRQPQYLRIKGSGSPKVLGPIVSFPAEPYAQPNRPVSLPVTLRNPLAKPVVFKLVLTKPDGSRTTTQVTVAGNTTKKQPLVFTMPKLSAKKPSISLVYELTGSPWKGELKLQLNTTRQLSRTLKNGTKPDFICETKKHIHNPNAFDPSRRQFSWQGKDDLSARVSLGLDEKHLLVRVEVRDDKHKQSYQPSAMWKGDSVQLALSIPGRNGLWQLGFAAIDSGKTLTHCWGTPVGLSAAYAQKIDLTTSRTPSGMAYVARLPFDGLGVDRKLLRSKAIRFNLLVNDDDGNGREGFCYIADGFGHGKTEPEKWPQISFD